MTEFSHDELRRATRELGSPTARDERSMRNVLSAALESDASPEDRQALILGRRRLITIGGFSVATAALLAACGGDRDKTVARVGLAPDRTDLPGAEVNDVVLLRTASSIEHSAIAVYETLIGNTDLLAPELQDAAKRFKADHEQHATVFEGLTKDAGGEPWTCGNPRIDDLLVAAVLAQIAGDEAKGITPSDDPLRDVANFAHALETLAGESYQSFVGMLSQPSLRKEVLTIGATEVRHAAVLAIAITGRPDGYIPPAEAPADPPKIPVVYAVPTAFGQLGGQQVVIGAEDADGVRKTFNVDTPSLNTFVYEYLTPEC